MARVVRKYHPAVADLAAAVNDLKTFVVTNFRLAKADLATATAAGTSWTILGFHDDQSERIVSKPNATDLTSSIALANELRGDYEFHRVDALAHKVKDTTNPLVAPLSYDLPTVIALANDLKTKFNLHRAVAASHSGGADSTNVVSAANATDLATSITLLNALKVAMNAHMASGAAAKSVRLIAG